LLKNDHYTAIP